MTVSSTSNISFNEHFLTVDGRPWFPVMGEIHYSRVKPERWETELLKMKAGGVELVSAYTIWIHHEETEGEWDFAGCRDLRSFVETVDRCGLHMILRIGPWAHGEVRNGGFPDWLMEKERAGLIKTRSDDPAYLRYARRFYEKIEEQVRGLLLKDNGPIIGIQIENEYGHCGGLQGEEGEQHMRTLQTMAKEIGFDVPLYTATGWGGAVTGGMLPVMGGYCEAPWDQRIGEIEPSGNYVFTEERNDHNIGSDHGLGAGITFDMNRFPYLTAELGGGLQVTKHRRPVASAKDIAAMSLVKIGSGCNLLGYYMYHGGTNPKGRRTTLQESRETGYPNDLPVLSYDFNAPIREYGQLTDTYREIRRLAMFTRDYQNLLCRTEYIPQNGNPTGPGDLKHVRTAVRVLPKESNEKIRSGFYFVNNYQRRYAMAEHKGMTPSARDEKGAPLAIYDVCDLKDGDYFFRPFNLPVGEGILKTTNAIPLCILNGTDYVFYVKSQTQPDYRFKGEPGRAGIITLTDEEALHACKCRIGDRDYLFISEGDVVQDTEGRPQLLLNVQDAQQPSFSVWPDLPKCPPHFRKTASAGRRYRTAASGIFARYVYDDILENRVNVQLDGEETGSDGSMKISAQIRIMNEGTDMRQTDEVLLHIAYEGDTAGLYSRGELTADNFYTGQVWEIGVSDLMENGSASLRFEASALTEESRDRLYLQEWPDMTSGSACRIKAVYTSVIYKIPVIV